MIVIVDVPVMPGLLIVALVEVKTKPPFTVTVWVAGGAATSPGTEALIVA